MYNQPDDCCTISATENVENLQGWQRLSEHLLVLLGQVTKKQNSRFVKNSPELTSLSGIHKSYRKHFNK